MLQNILKKIEGEPLDVENFLKTCAKKIKRVPFSLKWNEWKGTNFALT